MIFEPFMARPLRIFYPNAFYHVTCRGNERRDIYRDEEDRSLFLEKLKISLDIYGVRVHAYVLMRNHFHLIVETPKANLSEFMRHFNIAYTGAYNRRHRRVGHLYQGRFKAILVDKDSYLLELSRYVHLNPVRINPMRQRGFRESLRYLGRYRWSSLRGYLSGGRKEDWITYEEVLGYVGGSRRRYREFTEEGLEKGYVTPWEELKGQVVLGKEGFLARLKGRWRKGTTSTREIPSLRSLEMVEAEKVVREVAEYFKIKPEVLCRKRSGYRDGRGLAMELMYRYSAMSQGEIGGRMGGMDYTAVSRERKRLREKMEYDSKLKRYAKEIEARLMS